LSLPTFNGNSLHWQTFWDSFDAAVHSNTNHTGVQKFNYLKAQTSGDAARAISGFPLTNTNYEQAIIVLKERFGQSYKIVNAHMQALLNIPKPSTYLISLRQFYDTKETLLRIILEVCVR
jgi:phenylpropionate dioxygenase-like ring-hydroxylating dioxygenase large terminal subunit